MSQNQLNNNWILLYPSYKLTNHFLQKLLLQLLVSKRVVELLA